SRREFERHRILAVAWIRRLLHYDGEAGPRPLIKRQLCMDVRSHNRAAWNRSVEVQNRWTLPVGKEVIDRARGGEFDLLLTPTKPVPMDWFPKLAGTPTLCLASG